MKRRTITVYDYKQRPCDIPLPKESWWWGRRTGEGMGTLHCVISCWNESNVFYITDYGNARIAYCDSHAIVRIMNTIATGELERGIWCITENGKLKPHWYYNRYMKYMEKLHPKQAEKLKLKLKEFSRKV